MNKWIHRLTATAGLVGLVSAAAVGSATAAPREHADRVAGLGFTYATSPDKVAGHGSASPLRTAAVHGSAVVRLTFAPDTDVRTFTFDVRAKPYSRPMPGADSGLPTDATGTVEVSHAAGDGSWRVRFSAKADCLVTAPGIASFTAVVTSADPEAADLVGQRLGFSVSDQGRHGDRVGFSWAVVNADQSADGTWQQGRPGTCMAPAPYAPVVSGDYTVRHAELIEPPAHSVLTRP